MTAGLEKVTLSFGATRGTRSPLDGSTAVVAQALGWIANQTHISNQTLRGSAVLSQKHQSHTRRSCASSI